MRCLCHNADPASAPWRPPAAARARAAFSLIEVLVATTLLVIIVILIGMVYRQSALSWDSGIVRADGSMIVRSVVGAIERDLRAAVDGRRYSNAWTHAAAMDIAIGSDVGEIAFVALLEREGERGAIAPDREPTIIEYRRTNSSEDGVRVLVERRATPLVFAGGRWTRGATATTSLLYVPNVDAFTPTLWFSVPPAAGQGNRLPLWVNVEVELLNTEDFSGVAGLSLGRDGRQATRDDIRTQ